MSLLSDFRLIVRPSGLCENISGVASDEDAKADYSFVKYWLLDYQQREASLEERARELVREHWIAVQARRNLLNGLLCFPLKSKKSSGEQCQTFSY